MGIHERIVDLRMQEANDRVASKLAEDRLNRSKNERYRRELDPMIFSQRDLFTRLGELGVITMLEEMTYPSKITPIKTSAEKAASPGSVDLAIPIKAEEVRLPIDEVKKRIADLDNQKWHGSMLTPQQLKDGSPDSVLRIELSNYGGFHLNGKTKQRIVSVSYSQAEIFTIDGESTTFSGVVSKEHVDLSTLEDAFARAFHKPLIVPRPNFSNMIPTNFPIGEQVTSS